jgi:DNA-binding response OmpR family regulator
MSMNRVVIIEDEQHVREMIKYLMEKNNFLVDVFSSAEEFLMSGNFHHHCVYLVDSKLPGIQGPDVVKTIRHSDKVSPIFIVSGNRESEDITNGLHSGADDYIVKPFHPEHLVAKVTNASAKNHMIFKDLINVGLKLLPEAHSMIKDGVTVSLTPREFEILAELLKNANIIMSREEIVSAFENTELTIRNIDVHIFSLRKKISKVSIGIQTIRGKGYRLVT